MIFKNIEAAMLEIAYDNGMVNSYQSQQDILQSLSKYLENSGKYSLDFLRVVNIWLGKLHKDELYSLCCGSDVDQELILAMNAPKNTNEFLNDLFENVGA